ncbi:MAG: hypothetical protein KC620_07260, partial [Myxococcales bacterium]|nr:hypothetical protein [Myxococcales bacterium]
PPDGAAPDVAPDAALDLGPDAAPDAEPDAAPDAEADQGPEVPLIPYRDECENLTDTHCTYPWPTDRWLIEDETTVTGFRLAYDGHAFPPNAAGQYIDATPYARFDGFSPASQLLMLFPAAADLTGFDGPDRVDDSLTDDFPTVVLDLETGERVPHWIENDARADDPEDTVLYIRPATRLQPNHRYGVAIRNLHDADGALLPTPAGFAALRDDTPSGVPAFEARRAGYEDLFTALQTVGFARESLQMAWWFHTESRESLQDTLLAMRDDAVERLGPRGLGCTVTEVEDEPDAQTLRVVRGTITTPWYLDRGTQPAQIVTDDEGRPQFVETREVGFTAIIPRSAADAPARLVLFGHGLFGDADGTLANGRVREAANLLGGVFAGTDWAGMSSSDLGFLATALIDVSRFWYLGEMLRQGHINHIALARTMIGRCTDEPAFQIDDRLSYDPEQRNFYGISQGSILGGALMAIHPDITTSVLAVGGADFGFMIERSIHFDAQFQRLLTPNYPRRVDTALLMALSQHTWDRAETGTWMERLTDPAEGRRVLYLIAENDAQVPNLSSARAARLGHLPVLSVSTLHPWGLEVVDPPYAGSAMLAMDIGDRPTPAGNLSPQVDDGGHSGVSSTPAAMQTMGRFVETGIIDPPCDPVCRFRD